MVKVTFSIHSNSLLNRNWPTFLLVFSFFSLLDFLSAFFVINKVVAALKFAHFSNIVAIQITLFKHSSDKLNNSRIFTFQMHRLNVPECQKSSGSIEKFHILIRNNFNFDERMIKETFFWVWKIENKLLLQQKIIVEGLKAGNCWFWLNIEESNMKISYYYVPKTRVNSDIKRLLKLD